jgi:hypothetical protein
MRKSLWPVQMVLVICALLFCSRSAHGDVWKAQDLNCQIELPSGPDWNPVSPSAAMVKVAMRNQAKQESIALFVGDAPPASQTLETFLPGFTKTYFPAGVSTKKNEKDLMIDGRLACRFEDTVELQGQLIRRGTLVVLDGGKFYQVGVTSLSGNPLTDRCKTGVFA